MWSIILKQIESCREAKIGISSMVNAYHNSLGSVISSNLCKYWVAQKVCSGFSIPSYWKAQTNFLVNPIPCTVLGLLKKFFGVIIFIGLQLIHNIVLVSSVQQSESAMHIHISQMATHSSILAWRIPGTEELSGLLSMGSHRLRHDWSDLATAAGTLDGILCNSQNIRNIFCFCFLATALPTSGNITWIVEQKDLFPTGLDPQRRRG